ncbi:DUF7010 family protein [Bacillus marasmi]|uniref:DUF7010 family protein n=1 Tax=Bacillus marasmi TaxID=1926279 RepID=UPI0011C82AFD|nr:hypothetical protein [Bacillus marasmi]
MDLVQIKNDLSIRGKNGIGFLLSGSVIWTIITVIFFQEMDIQIKNILMLFATGIMFPLAILISKIIKAEWIFKDVPLSSLGVIFNVAQFFYFPIMFYAFAKSPNEMVLFFAIITGAHFFPYGWLYNCKPFYFLSPILAVMIVIIGWSLEPSKLWLIPLSLVIMLLLLITMLYVDYMKKAKRQFSVNNEHDSMKNPL